MAGRSEIDWQIRKKQVKERGQYLLETGIWSDCRFVVGTEPNQQILEGHKLFLAMASPVFEAMFFGGMAEKDPIAILDVQPEAFKALLEYIYTDKINLTSFDQACELCYGAKKYMLPHLVEECTKYLWSDLFPKNACRAYEFAKLFEEPVLMDKCLHMICNQTQEVLSESSFEDVELTTIMTIFDQDVLNINSELELFTAISRYAAKQSQFNASKTARVEQPGTSESSQDGTAQYPTIRDAIKKIRFLTLSPQQFAENPATSNLLTQNEKFAILMNISSQSTDIPMPEGFTTNKWPRKKKFNANELGFPSTSLRASVNNMRDRQLSNITGTYESEEEDSNSGPAGDQQKKIYCCNRELIRTTDCFNNNLLDCSMTFSCDKNICVHGIQVPTQIGFETNENTSYTEVIYAHLCDGDGSRLTYTHYTSKVSYRSFIDISFNRPVYIQKNKVYKIGVILNNMGLYPLGVYNTQTVCNGVTFNFIPRERDGLVRSIKFSIPSSNIAMGVWNLF